MTTRATQESASGGHLERFDPAEQGGRLIDAEHRARYWWAAQAVGGRDVLDAGCGTGYGAVMLKAAGAASVTAVDISAEAVEIAESRLGNQGSVIQCDLRELPFGDASFDLVVCWETIEHIDEGERAVGELRRVLRPDGLLLISSPNPDVYPPGNEYHVHEYRAGELAAMLGECFANVSSYGQYPRLASLIERGGPQVGGHEPGAPERREVRALAPSDERRETYALIAASDAPLPDLHDLVTMGEPFEVRWWTDRLNTAERAAAQAEAREAEVTARLAETSAALLDANQALVRMPLLEHHASELRARNASIERSISWRLTAPLRQLRRILLRVLARG